ncbi:MAG: DUF2339 domain-containing protein [Azoarcus sp.]|jgi:uncharacterized membrane protein|nr:DUF2339 domain-containing protein [Azoarcus sp.]
MMAIILFLLTALLFSASEPDFSAWWLLCVVAFLWFRFTQLQSEVHDLQKQLDRKARAPARRESARPASSADVRPAHEETPVHPDRRSFPFGSEQMPIKVDAPATKTQIEDVKPAEEPLFKQPASIPETPVAPAAPPASEPIKATGPKEAAKPAVRTAARPRTPEKPYRLEPLEPSPFEKLILKAFTGAKNWLLGGNIAVRVGLVVFFLGLAWLLRYASELYELPVEFRYIGVSAVALVLLVLGWRLRLKRPSYALMLQGGGIGILYLTTFAAMRLHDLIPSKEAFVLMAVLTAAAVALAIMQNAIGLACAAILGGFASPILVSTGGGNHVALFSYFALLNTGIALIAWFKAWRVLNLIGFIGTFSIGTAWGLRSYEAGQFASTEPFLILFLLMYVVIGLLFARRKLIARGENEKFSISPWSATNTDYLDGTLTFGPPIIGFGLQCAVISHIEYGMAFSALVLGLLYLSLAYVLRGRPAVRLMTEVYLALGVVFGTLVIPLALNAQWTSAAWALEGAGIYWIAYRQRRLLGQGFSLSLILVASFLYLIEISINQNFDPILNGRPMGALLLGFAYLACYYVRWRALGDPKENPEQPLTSALAIAGMAFLYLIAPLVFGWDGTIIAWALAGLATMFAHTRLASRVFLFGALVIQSLASLMLLAQLRPGYGDALLSGISPISSALVGVTWLAGFFLLFRTGNLGLSQREKSSELFFFRVFSILGLSFLYLAVPLVFGRDGTVVAWALAGLATMFAGTRIASHSVIGCAFAIQVIGGLLFLFGLEIDYHDFSLLSGWEGALRTVLIGAALFISALLVINQKGRPPTSLARDFALLAMPVWTGLFFINLAFLFLLNWGQVGAAWAASGLLILWLALWKRIPSLMYFGIVLKLAAGFAFYTNHAVGLTPSNGWIAAALALAALVGAWRLCQAAPRPAPGDRSSTSSGIPTQGGVLSNMLLIWGAIWWVWCAADRVTFYMEGASFWGVNPMYIRMETAYLILLALSFSGALWAMLSNALKWCSLALLSLLHLGVAALVLAKQGVDLHWVVGVSWAVFFLVHLFTLRILSRLLPDIAQRVAHVAGAWFGILVLMLAATKTLEIFVPDAQYSAWRWLAWAFVPSLYLWFAARNKARFWPVAAFKREYNLHAAFPVMAGMMLWFWVANLMSNGNCAPLPYLPLVNPLELGLFLVLFACWRWCLFWIPKTGEYQGALKRVISFTGLASIFSVATLAVCRVAHAWSFVPFDIESMIEAMGVQASWSIIWSLFALALMIRGSLGKDRTLWIAGAALTGSVVLKLFFVELSDHGGLARIVSFIGVGILLLVVGYFAPMPPKIEEEAGRT